MNSRQTVPKSKWSLTRFVAAQRPVAFGVIAIALMTISSLGADRVVAFQQEQNQSQRQAEQRRQNSDERTRTRESKSDSVKSEDSTPDNARRMSPEAREELARQFVTDNHPELNRLLDVLQKRQPREYQRAIRELFRQSQHINSLKERNDQAKYELVLEIWKLGSRARVLAAQLMMRDSDEGRQRLSKLVTQESELRARLLQLDRDRLQRRVDSLDEQINQLGEETTVERRVRSLLNSAESLRKQSDQQKRRGTSERKQQDKTNRDGDKE